MSYAILSWIPYGTIWGEPLLCSVSLFWLIILNGRVLIRHHSWPKNIDVYLCTKECLCCSFLSKSRITVYTGVLNTNNMNVLWYPGCMIRDHSVYVPSQWKMVLHFNAICHWLGPYTEWSLYDGLYPDNHYTMKTTGDCFCITPLLYFNDNKSALVKVLAWCTKPLYLNLYGHNIADIRNL